MQDPGSPRGKAETSLTHGPERCYAHLNSEEAGLNKLGQRGKEKDMTNEQPLNVPDEVRKAIDEVMKLQTEYMTQSFATLRGQIQDAGQALQAQTRAAAADIVNETRKVQDKARDAVEKTVAAAKDAASKAPFKK
jgi:hypothetical protein